MKFKLSFKQTKVIVGRGIKIISFALILILLFSQGGQAVVALADTTSSPKEKVKTLLSHQLSYFQQLKSIEYAGTWADEDKEGKTFRKVQFIMSGEKFYRAVSYLDPSNKETVAMKSAFDGEKYQYFQKGVQDKGILILSSNPLINDPTTTADIFYKLYGFIIPFGKNIPFNKFKEEKLWEELANMVTDCEEITKEKVKGLKINLKRPKEKIGEGNFTYSIERSFEIFFASDYEYFPLYIKSQFTASPLKEGQMPGSMMVEEIKVTEIKLFDNIPFPTKLEIISMDTKGKIIGKSNFALDPYSLKINQKVEEKIFTIPRTGVGTIINEDTKEVIHQ
jgi:hypothetical protein